MKPDKRTCLNCGKDISDKRVGAKFCSDKCTKAYARNSDIISDKINSDNPEPPKDEQVGHVRDSLTKTDKTFYDRAMKDFGEPYYRFGETDKQENCLQCGVTFRTSLTALRFCSYNHYKEAISGKL